MDKRVVEEALNSMLRTDYIALNDTRKLALLADYYIDYFGYLGQVLSETDQIIVGRRGTGKTTLLYRALVDCMRSWAPDATKVAPPSRAKPRTLGIYLDLEKCQSLSASGSFQQFEHAFVSELCDALTAELTRSWPALTGKQSLFTKLFQSLEQRKAREARTELAKLGEVLRSGVPRFVDRTGEVQTTSRAKTGSHSGLGVEFGIDAKGPHMAVSANDDEDYETEDEIVATSRVTYRLMVSDLMRVIGDLRKAADIPCVLLFIDEYSALTEDLQRRFSSLLKKSLETMLESM